jgi:hypothetical protein
LVHAPLLRDDVSFQTLANEKENAPLEHNPGAYSVGK